MKKGLLLGLYINQDGHYTIENSVWSVDVDSDKREEETINLFREIFYDEGNVNGTKLTPQEQVEFINDTHSWNK